MLLAIQAPIIFRCYGMNKMKYFYLMGFVLSLLLNPSVSHSGQKALLVGINDYKHLLPAELATHELSHDLRGPINDVKLLKYLLVKQGYFQEEDIKTLLDRQASQEGIRKAFKSWLIRETSPGDMVLFYYSGHGAQVKDYSGDEADGKDEVLCPWDIDPVNGRYVLTDDEIGGWLDELKGRQIVMLVDACHSGTISRSIGNFNVSTLEPNRMMTSRYLPITYDQPEIFSRGTVSKKSDIPDGVVLMAASRDNQTALELSIQNKFHGGFTFGLAKSMYNSTDPTYSELFEGMRKIVKDELNLPQDPALGIEGGEKQLLNNQAFVLPKLKPNAIAVQATPNHPVPEKEPFVEQKKPSQEQVLVALDDIQGMSQEETQLLSTVIGSFDFVKVVPKTASFDRIIKGEKIDGSYRIRLINQPGDVQQLPETKAIDVLTKSLQQPLEYAYIAKAFSAFHNPDSEFKIDLSISDASRRDFFFGEELIFQATSEKDCYLLLLNLDNTGNIHVIYPNAFHSDNYLPAGELLKVPDQKARSKEFYLEFGPPAGEERVLAIASRTPIDFRALNIDQFGKLFENTAPITQALQSRMALLKKIAAVLDKSSAGWSSDTVIVRSHEKKK